MNRSDTLTKIAPALVAALGKIEGAAKKKVNPGFKSKYADLETVIDASRDILTEHGITLIQLPGSLVNGVLTLETILLHESGEFISGDFGIQLGKSDPQGVGSALTYARRYAQMAALNMPAVDDDGEASMGRGSRQKPQEVPPMPGGVAPEGPDFWNCDGPGMTAHAAKKEGLGEVHDAMREGIAAQHSSAAMREWINNNLETIRKMPRPWRVILRQDCEEQAKDFGPPETDRRSEDSFRRPSANGVAGVREAAVA